MCVEEKSVKSKKAWHQTFTVRRLGAALLLVRQSGEFVASAQRQLSRLRLLFTAVSRRFTETLRARHGDLKLLQDLVLAVRGAGASVVTVAVHWMETNTRKQTGIDEEEKLEEFKRGEEIQMETWVNLSLADPAASLWSLNTKHFLTICTWTHW